MNYKEHDIVKRMVKLRGQIWGALEKLEKSQLTVEQKEELSFNVEGVSKQMLKFKNMLKSESELVITVEFKKLEDWIDITYSDAVLLKIDRLNDILERKLNRIEQATAPKKLTREQKLIALKARAADPFYRSGF